MIQQLKEDISRLRSIPIYIDISFYLLLILLPLAHFFFEGLASGLATFFILPLVFSFVLLHEYGHCWAAQKFGFPIKCMKLWFLGGQAHILNMRDATPKQDLIVAIAGPMVNFVLFFLFFIVILAFGSYNILVLMAGINLALGVFNIIPAYPMDGGRILFSILHHFTGSRNMALTLSAKISIAISIGFIILGLILGHLLMVLIFLWISTICYSILCNPDTLL